MDLKSVKHKTMDNKYIIDKFTNKNYKYVSKLEKFTLISPLYCSKDCFYVFNYQSNNYINVYNVDSFNCRFNRIMLGRKFGFTILKKLN